MFSFFGKQQARTKIIDRIFVSSIAKQNAILEKIRNQTNSIIITWFDESHTQMENLILSNNLKAEIYMAREIAAHHIHNNPVLFFEHHPFLIKENELLEKLQLKEAAFYSSLEEPIFMHFGSKRIALLMQKMGLSENEAIEHPMITTAIKHAQEKISKELVIEHSATSQAEWFSKNIVK
jgi:hypothetical protein